MGKRLIFLDFDGVIVNRKSLMKASGLSSQSDPECVTRINRIVEATGADIVVSSTWRRCGYQECCDFLKNWGLVANVVVSHRGSTTFSTRRAA